MKLIVIKSTQSEVPLAEIAIDNSPDSKLDFRIDNTSGKLPKLAQNSYQKLVQIIKRSSHLTMEEPKNATIGLLRYVLNNGDVCEITTDGKTAILNGSILQEDEKQALFAAIKSGQLQVARKADIARPVPIIPSSAMARPVPVKPMGLDPDVLRELDYAAKEKKRQKDMSGPDYDYQIETADLRGAEDPAYVKKLMYTMKYGDK